MDMTTCAAPDCTALREKLYHCTAHIRQFYPKYIQYKELESNLQYILEKKVTTHDTAKLLHYYAQLKKVYELRKEYRALAFRKEYWDSGHEFRLEYILTRMIEIETELSNLFAKRASLATVSPIEDSDSEEEELDSNDELEEVLTQIKENNERIVEEEQVWNELIPSLALERIKQYKRYQTLLKYIKIRCINLTKEYYPIDGEHWILTPYCLDHLVFFYITAGLIFAEKLARTKTGQKKRILHWTLHLKRRETTCKRLNNLSLVTLETVVQLSTQAIHYDKLLLELLLFAGWGDKEVVYNQLWPRYNITLLLLTVIEPSKVDVCLTFTNPEAIGFPKLHCGIHYSRNTTTNTQIITNDRLPPEWLPTCNTKPRKKGKIKRNGKH
jgi:hypothetical protein